MAIHHLAFRTRAVARLVDFYSKVFSLRVERVQGDRSTWLSAGETLIMIEEQEENEPSPNPASLDLVAFSIPARERGAFEARLTDLGIVIEGRTAYSLYFRDPDGRRVGASHYPDAAL